ncbi:hypothetical protein CFT13S00388_02460 [Campylobacter fetus subsp. testudinum]|uniref:hypothetical protein n=1 Tax=Campylobacter fetus TaxID=196 RepID=UPI000818A88A|nr:hypothetical protein [Campylobacter fetus]OCR88050.1 hypothetical protein CFT13S00388_02460 [Campylobacter fetus subsp. testudinum]
MFNEFIENFTWSYFLSKCSSYYSIIREYPHHKDILLKEFYEFIDKIPVMILNRLPCILIVFLVLSVTYISIRNKIYNNKLQEDEYHKTLVAIFAISFLLGDNILALPIFLVLCSFSFLKNQSFVGIKNNFISLYTYSIIITFIIAILKEL